MNEKCSLVFTGGEGPVVKPLLFEKYPYSRIIAADSGYDTARKLSMKIDDAVGDFDSSQYRDELIAEGFVPCPRDKDYSDSELALMRLDTTCYDLAGGGGARLDHLLSLTGLFPKYGYPRFWFTRTDLIITVNNASVAFSLPPGSDISFMTLEEKAAVSCSHLVWPLDSFVLSRTSVSLSNRNSERVLDISTCGIVLCRVDISNADCVTESFKIYGN